jgi:hypothetical protein
MNSKKQKLGLAGAFFLLILISSCTKDGIWYSHNWDKDHPAGQSASLLPCDTSGVISYSTTIQPLIVANCATGMACHSGIHGSPAPTNYNTFSVVVTDAQTGSGTGTIMSRMDLPTSNIQHMPQNNLTTMLPCDTMKIRKWIYAGCPNN